MSRIAAAARTNRSPRRGIRISVERTTVDDLILAALRDNSRASAAAIARQLGLAPSTVKRRIEALNSEGTITRFTIETATRPLDARAIVEVYCRGNASVSELREIVAELPHVSLAVSVAGAADAVIVVEGATSAQVSSTIETLRMSPRIERTRTSMVFQDLLT